MTQILNKIPFLSRWKQTDADAQAKKRARYFEIISKGAEDGDLPARESAELRTLADSIGRLDRVDADIAAVAELARLRPIAAETAPRSEARKAALQEHTKFCEETTRIITDRAKQAEKLHDVFHHAKYANQESLDATRRIRELEKQLLMEPDPQTPPSVLASAL